MDSLRPAALVVASAFAFAALAALPSAQSGARGGATSRTERSPIAAPAALVAGSSRDGFRSAPQPATSVADAATATTPAAHSPAAQAAVKPPPGYTALYNGRDLAGWRGGDTFDHRKYLAMPEEERAKQDAAWTADMRAHWRAEGPELVNDGAGKYATTIKEYGDFELHLEYKTVPKADSGIYLRGCPQVQIWDHTNPAEFKNGADKGSGGLWNNSRGAPGKDPLVLADKPFGEWNHFRIVMVGDRVSVWLNDKLVVDNAVMENYFDRKQPVPARGPIQLQTHGGEIRWRNIFIRELGRSGTVAR